MASPRPVLLLCASTRKVPCCPHHPCSAAGHPASPSPASGHPLRPLRACPALQTPHPHPGPNGGWGQDSTAWQSDPPRAPPCPAHPGGVQNEVTTSPREGPLSGCQPSSAGGLSAWLSPPLPQNHAWRARPGADSGRAPPGPEDVPPPPLMGAAKARGPGRQLCPRSPRKRPQDIGALGWVGRPVMAPHRELNLRPGAETGCGQEVALCCLQSRGRGGLSDPQTSHLSFQPPHLHAAQRSSGQRLGQPAST